MRSITVREPHPLTRAEDPSRKNEVGLAWVVLMVFDPWLASVFAGVWS
jgi:hypothetical protein